MRLILFLLIFPILSIAHPGIGIVKDSKGNIYYTDLSKVWRIDRQGVKSVIVKDVHTHELYMDANDNLYGEHLWYNGEQLDTWGHYVWCLRSNGKLDTIIPPSAGFLENYSFVRDAEGNMYWPVRNSITQFRKRSPDGRLETIAKGKFDNVRWSYMSKEGILYFEDLDKLYKLGKDGKFSMIASNLDDGKTGFGFNRRHNVYGIWEDGQKNIYVAIMAGRKVKRVRPDGVVETVAYSYTPWAPTAGLFDDNGDLWLLENSLTNNVRARKISKDLLKPDPPKTKAIIRNYMMPYTVIGAILILVTLIIVKMVRKLSLKKIKT